jgi:hypothetical protein
MGESAYRGLLHTYIYRESIMAKHMHFQYLPMSLRVLYTMVLLVFGAGYLFAMIHVFETNAGKDGDPMLSEKDLMITYGGNPQGTALETALRGPMQDMLPADKRQAIIDWLHGGAKQEEFDARINPIVQEHCIGCHVPEANPQLTDLRTYAGIAKVSGKDEGMSLGTLVRVSHIHLFSIAFIFFIVGQIYSHAWVRPVWLKCVVIAAPFAVVLTDVGSWYMTKVWAQFAWVVIGSGAVMGLAFAIMWVTSIYQLWIFTIPPELVRDGGEVPVMVRG